MLLRRAVAMVEVQRSQRAKPGCAAGIVSLVCSVLGVAFFLAGIMVALPYFAAKAAGTEVSKRGVAETQHCRYSWVLSGSQEDPERNVTGLGWVCWAEVTWDDGDVQLREVKQSQLEPEDVGRQVPVVGREVRIDEAGG